MSQAFPVESRLTAREALSGVFLWFVTPLLTVMAATLYIRMRTPTRLYEQMRPQVVTACPSCQAPISYAPSEGPLRIKCASCGREGILRPGRAS
jgi:LSD1 subclass zinc finger protein